MNKQTCLGYIAMIFCLLGVSLAASEHQIRRKPIQKHKDAFQKIYRKIMHEESQLPPSIKNSIGMEFSLIEAGSFSMGSPLAELGREPDESPAHRVTLSHSYYLGKYEVTQDEWKAVMGYNPSGFKACGNRCPVERISWIDAEKFIDKLNIREGCLSRSRVPGAQESNHLARGCYRLPTEAEWEYAARAGTTTAYHWGNDFDCSKAMAENDPGSTETKCVDYVRAHGLTSDSTAPVGSYPPNPWGLYDMSGNVWEWVYDRHGFYGSSHQTDPTGPEYGSHRVLRGGSWGSPAHNNRVGNRNHDLPSRRDSFLGFRILKLINP